MQAHRFTCPGCRRPCEERERLSGTALLPQLNRKLLAQLQACQPRASLVHDVLQACDSATLIRMRPVLRALEDGSVAWLGQHSADAGAALRYLALTLRAHRELLRPPQHQAGPQRTLAFAAPCLAALDWDALPRCAQRNDLAKHAGAGSGL